MKLFTFDALAENSRGVVRRAPYWRPAVPPVFDDSLILPPILYGDLFPLVKVATKRKARPMTPEEVRVFAATQELYYAVLCLPGKSDEEVGGYYRDIMSVHRRLLDRPGVTGPVVESACEPAPTRGDTERRAGS